MLLTPAEVASFERDGLVTVDAPVFLNARTLAAAESAADRVASAPGEPPLFRTYTPDERPLAEPDIVALYQQPYLEACAKRLLRAQHVHVWNASVLVVHPLPRMQDAETAAHARGLAPRPRPIRAHVDTHMTTACWEATPRDTTLFMWLWLSDAIPARAPMYYLPGSHRTLAAYWSAHASTHPAGGRHPVADTSELDPHDGIDLQQPLQPTQTLMGAPLSELLRGLEVAMGRRVIQTPLSILH
jgi:hypothetical protein